MNNNEYRDHYCGEVTEQDVEKEIRIAGWIENIRDHGGVIFVDESFVESTALMRAPDGTIVTAYELHDCEAVS